MPEAALGRVLLIAPQRVAVADAIAGTPNVVEARLLRRATGQHHARALPVLLFELLYVRDGRLVGHVLPPSVN